MASYRRFISYIHVYRNGRKEQNIGFARVEVRDGRWKLCIQLTGIRGGEGLSAYAFCRQGDCNLGISLGELCPGNPPCLNLSFPENDIAGSGRSLRELSGIWIKGLRGENYITSWVDAPLTSMELTLELREEEMEPLCPEKAVCEEQSSQREAEPEEQSSHREAEPGEQSSHREPGEQSSHREPEAGERLLNGVRAQEAAVWQENSGESADEEDIFRSAAAFAPFLEQKEGTLCVRISPRELPGDWDVRTKNYLLRAYYRYHHLLLGREEGSLFLGVPGMYEPRTRQLALDLGFPVFREAREERLAGRFGYWCRPLS